MALPLYVTHDLAFDLGEPFSDQTIHELDAPLPGPGKRVFSMLIERSPIASTVTLADAAQAFVVEEGRRLPLHRVLDVQEVAGVGAPGGTAIAVVFEWTHSGARHYGRHLHVLAKGSLHLCFAATTPYDQRGACDEYFDRLTQTLELQAG